MNAQPIPDHPVLEITNDEKILCAGDLHIGLEEELRRKGIHVPSQTHRMEEELHVLSKSHDRLILLGDIKHQVPGTTRQENIEIPLFLTKMKALFKRIDIVKGNHDGGVEECLPDGVVLHSSAGFSVGNIGFLHGHTWPSLDLVSCEILVMSHNHPTVIFEDGLGNVQTEPCWLRASPTNTAFDYFDTFPNEIIIMPALNRMLGGSPVNTEDCELLGPLFKNKIIDVANAEVHLLDGVNLGRVKDITVSYRNRGSLLSR
ncbi:MAG: metallophosphoesterase [Methanomassiliicoccales archaeon]|nr:metallophosphoesterase [Methanomassiliicoccales archaeon]